MHKIEHELFKEMVLSASVHVHRQQLAGKHEQDRSDAVDWIERYGEAVARLKLSEATLTYEEALEFGEQLSTELSELRMKVSALGISEAKKVAELEGQIGDIGAGAVPLNYKENNA